MNFSSSSGGCPQTIHLRVFLACSARRASSCFEVSGDLDAETTPSVNTIAMESFIVYELNKAAYKKDLDLLPLYGPYAAVLSYILGHSRKGKRDQIELYRGARLTIKDI